MYSSYLTITTGNSMFAECSTFCRVYFFVHSANKVFAECHTKNTRQNKYTRQTILCRVYYILALGKDESLPSVFLHSANSSLPSVLFLALGKDHNLPSVFIYTWQRIKLFLTSNPKTFSTLHIQLVLLHVKILYIFVFVCYT